MNSTVLNAVKLHTMLDAARARTLQLVDDVSAEQWLGPRLAIVNPPLWELGHLGWFEERWCLRYRGQGKALGPSMLDGADALYDSAQVPHDQRWDLPLPDAAHAMRYLADVRAAVTDRLERQPHDPALAYFVQLCAFHEEMHCEALTYTRQTLGYPEPPGGNNNQHNLHRTDAGECAGDVEISGGQFFLGARESGAFVFDNEKWAHKVEVRPFRMARAPVTNARFADFIEAGGYHDRRWWSVAGWAWREQAGAETPVYWRRSGDGWKQRRFNREEVLPAHEPVIHVNWYEAEAWCRWAQRRLPTEAEWEFAASTVPNEPTVKRSYPWGDAEPGAEKANLWGLAGRCAPVSTHAAGDSAWGVRQMIGNVWEWTADWFQPYPGFVRDPYAEYSEPWFGNHKVLRGGCHATNAGLIRNTWRNFYTPERRDIFSGFRTCAL